MDVLGSEAYWRHEQDILFDVVRQMKERHMDSENYPELMELQLKGEAFLNQKWFTSLKNFSKLLRHRSVSKELFIMQYTT